jgi:PAS domain S-box-containing protein
MLIAGRPNGRNNDRNPMTDSSTDTILRTAHVGILDVAEDGIVTVDERRRIILFNHGAEKVFNYGRAEVLGQELEILLPKRFAAAHVGQVESFARGPVASRLMGERSEVYGRRKDGSEFPADVSISRHSAGGRMFLTAIVRDATERMQARDAILRLNAELERRVEERTAELVEANRQLQRQSEENETFVYSVSHDLRAPLVNLEGFSKELRIVCDELRKLLSDPTIPEDVRRKAEQLIRHDMDEPLDYIHAAVARLSRIIDALLRLSRAGRVEYMPQRVDVTALVRRILESLRGTINERQAEVVVGHLAPAWGDPVAIEQVFANLIGNALKYLDPARPGRIEVGRRQTPDGPAYFVSDNGLGIPVSYLPQLFHAFRRLHPDVAGGEGMGLAIVRRVVERHSGCVWAESELGNGTTFFVTFPEPARTGEVRDESQP